MHWPIRNQILLPFAMLQGLAIAVISLSASWIAADRAERESIARLDQVVGTLSASSFPVRGPVLEQMKGLSGADFIAASDSGTITATTLPESTATGIIAAPRTVSTDSRKLGEFQPLSINGERWLVGGVQVLRSSELKELLVLVPEREWQAVRREVILPPLLIGGCTMLAMVVLSWVIAAKLGARLDRMQHHVGKLATLQFENLLPVTGHDELSSLATSINHMAQGLQQATQQIRMAERTALIAQVAGGLAHQLRNSITGARMAIQLHLRRSHDANKESLQVAIRQLNLTENQIFGLLSLTRDSRQPVVAGHIHEIMNTIRELLEPQFQHSESSLEIELSAEIMQDQLAVNDSEQIQAALLNLVQNALEASRPGGSVRVIVSILESMIQVDVLDNGPGVADAVRGKIFDPFVTGKPEGVGLGLTLAAQAAESSGGSLNYLRLDQWTQFRFQVRRHVSELTCEN
ncbi:MAG: sensor histidine kinase [Planctomycetota bacterium]|nr:MAG: sensor histidine kinase [Planctomycetota bacterium]